MTPLADFVRRRRSELGLTQASLAKKAGEGVSEGWISRLEAGKESGQPKPSTLRLLAEALGISYGDILRLAGHELPGNDPMAAVQEHVLGDLELIKLKIAAMDGAIRAMRDGIVLVREDMAPIEAPFLGKMKQALAQEERAMDEIRGYFEAELGRPIVSEGFALWVQALKYHDVDTDLPAIHRIVGRIRDLVSGP